MWLAPCVPREVAVEVLENSTGESYHVVVVPLVSLPNPQITILVGISPKIFSLILVGDVDAGASSSGMVLVALGFWCCPPPCPFPPPLSLVGDGGIV